MVLPFSTPEIIEEKGFCASFLGGVCLRVVGWLPEFKTFLVTLVLRAQWDRPGNIFVVTIALLLSVPTSTQELGLIRKPASFMTSICDERGQELIYAGMPITEVFKEEMGIGGVLGLLWFQRR